MFRAPCAHRQEVKIVLYSLWYHHTYRWPSRAQVESWNEFKACKSNGDNNRQNTSDVRGPADISKLVSFRYVLLCKQVSYVQQILFFRHIISRKYAIKVLPSYTPSVFLSNYALHICRDAGGSEPLV